MTVKLEAIGVAHESTGLHTEQCIVRFVVALIDIVRVIGGQQWRTNLFCQLDQLRVGANLIGDAVVLHFNKEIVFAENILETSGLLQGTLFIAVENGLQNVPAQAASGGDKT